MLGRVIIYAAHQLRLILLVDVYRRRREHQTGGLLVECDLAEEFLVMGLDLSVFRLQGLLFLL
jgi:hypothetical protein